MNINGKLGDFDVNQLIGRAKIRKFLEIVGNEAKEYIYNQTLEGNFANGGPFQYADKEYEDKKRKAGRFRGHVDFFGFSHPNTINTMMTNVTDERYALTVTGDAAYKTLKWRGRYNWFSFGGTREEPIKAMVNTVNQSFDWGG